MLMHAPVVARGSSLARKVCRTSMAWPQCRQTKVGFGVVVGARAVSQVLDAAPLAWSKSARRGQAGLAAAVGEQPVVADAVEAAGQDVQQEAAHELVGS